MLALGVDTSNYATSLAVVDTGRREVVCAVKKMLTVPKGQTGLRQSEAVFQHVLALPALLEEMTGKTTLQQINCVTVSEIPRHVEGSYMPCFLAGVGFASAFAQAKGLVLHKTSHQQGHLAAALFGSGQPPRLEGQPFLFFHASGGTTELLLCEDYLVHKKLGGTLDLYAGQAVDRLGVQLRFGFPAGAALSSLAAQCDEPMRPRVTVHGMDCHLSGLENQCNKLLSRGKSGAYAARYCLLVVAETVVQMVANARAQLGPLPILCAGGVMSSDIIRPYIEDRLPDVWFAPPELSGDNAVGVALIGAKQQKEGFDGGRDLDISPE